MRPPSSERHQPTRESTASRSQFLCGDYKNGTPGCVEDMLNVLHRESLETRRKNNRLSLFLKIYTGQVDIIIDQYLQRSDPRNRGAQRFRLARADHIVLYHSFIPATIRQWNTLPTNIPATTCPRCFQGWPSCLNICFTLIVSQDFVHRNNTFGISPEVHIITILTFNFIFI